ncbi:hypothetical protein COCOBI_07-0200 [Coccomyxa sp. Obi]|nr:hypothetical protein COCOBI_07-0200 [Coccomyxa sp. Obi]
MHPSPFEQPELRKAVPGVDDRLQKHSTAVAAIFRKQTGKKSSCSGALISSIHIDQNGLKPLLTCQEFVDAPEPEKWGREQEIAQEKSALRHQGADCQNAEGSHHSSDSSSEESSEESAEKSGKKRAAANGIPDKRVGTTVRANQSSGHLEAARSQAQRRPVEPPGVQKSLPNGPRSALSQRRQGRRASICLAG